MQPRNLLSISLGILALVFVPLRHAHGQALDLPSGDLIPNFGGNPDVVSVANGPWSAGSTWSTGGPPGAGDSVTILNDVTYDAVSFAPIHTIVIKPGGALRFATNANTKLVVSTLEVMPEATLEIGTEAQRVAEGVRAEVVFAAQAINTGLGPKQYGTGLIGVGKVTVHGWPKTAFVRLAQEPKAGSSTLILEEAVSGWKPGDILVLPDSRDADARYQDESDPPQWERATITSVSPDGKTVALAAPLAFSHPGAVKAGGEPDPRFRPHVANLTRNVVFKPQTPGGTRGHIFLTYRAEVDIRYARFENLGRTTTDDIDNTTFDENGQPASIGTNQIGRYAGPHMHHLMGPLRSPDFQGYQFTLVGNVVDGDDVDHNRKWSYVIHHSHHGLVRENVAYNCGGACFVTEDGEETSNVIEGNLAIRSAYGNPDDLFTDSGMGRQGDCYWFRGNSNRVRNNVAASCGIGAFGRGYMFQGYRLGEIAVPKSPGSDEFDLVEHKNLPMLEFAGNEAYGPMFTNLELWEIGSVGDDIGSAPDSLIKNFAAWNIFRTAVALYRVHQLVFEGTVLRGRPESLSYNWTSGIILDDAYLHKPHTVRNADIQGLGQCVVVHAGVLPKGLVGNFFNVEGPQDQYGVMTVEDSDLKCYTGPVIAPPRSGGSPRQTIVRNVRFDRVNAALQDSQQWSIFLYLDTNPPMSAAIDCRQKDEVYVHDYNGQPGRNFRAYYPEQVPWFVMPQSNENSHVCADEPHLTNAEAMAKYGYSIAGGIAPPSATYEIPEVWALIDSNGAPPLPRLTSP